MVTLQPLEHAIHRARAPAAGHGDVEFVGVVACVGGDGGGVGHFRLLFGVVWLVLLVVSWCWRLLEMGGGVEVCTRTARLLSVRSPDGR